MSICQKKKSEGRRPTRASRPQIPHFPTSLALNPPGTPLETPSEMAPRPSPDLQSPPLFPGVHFGSALRERLLLRPPRRSSGVWVSLPTAPQKSLSTRLFRGLQPLFPGNLSLSPRRRARRAWQRCTVGLSSGGGGRGRFAGRFSPSNSAPFERGSGERPPRRGPDFD